MNLKNGTLNYNINDGPYNSSLEFDNNPNLEFICADYNFPFFDDGIEISTVQSLIDSYGYTDCFVSSYCSFVPGGSFSIIEGNVLVDSDTNGCDSEDSNFPHLSFSISNGTETGSFIANGSGYYNIPIQNGNHTITPILENLNYYTISPSTISVSFPSDTSPYLQDFCIIPNGIHHDLEIILIPLNSAIPGFDTNYKLIYKNKGTSTLSGNIDLSFQDDVMDFASASPNVDSQSASLLSWNFADLAPFENREIDLVMNMNTPMDTPPLNDGEILTFTSTISSSETDETPDDNTFELNQTVVNSFDPNDKTCLEGAIITPDMVGKYVHYMIRFENTGTADAINIVVKDHIDITKYDISTLIPISASHDFFANIKDDAPEHYVEFIFENINLPFDDANNDGFIVFKIKTLDTLELNDTFENEAEIYFDFNFPIITNVAQTTVSTLSTEEFSFNNNISVYPNPTTDVLHIASQQEIQKVVIYDLSGRIIQTISGKNTNSTIEISTRKLSAGSYFVQIHTTQDTFVKQVIKK